MIPEYILRDGVVCKYNYSVHMYVPVTVLEDKFKGLAWLYKEATGQEVKI